MQHCWSLPPIMSDQWTFTSNELHHISSLCQAHLVVLPTERWGSRTWPSGSAASVPVWQITTLCLFSRSTSGWPPWTQSWSLPSSPTPQESNSLTRWAIFPPGVRTCCWIYIRVVLYSARRDSASVFLVSRVCWANWSSLNQKFRFQLSLFSGCEDGGFAGGLVLRPTVCGQ